MPDEPSEVTEPSAELPRIEPTASGARSGLVPPWTSETGAEAARRRWQGDPELADGAESARSGSTGGDLESVESIRAKLRGVTRTMCAEIRLIRSGRSTEENRVPPLLFSATTKALATLLEDALDREETSRLTQMAADLKAQQQRPIRRRA